MRSRLLLLPVAGMATAASADQPDIQIYLTVAQAQAALAPGATFKEDFLFLSEQQYDRLQRDSGTTQWSHQIKAWRVSTGGWFIVDQVPGRDNMVTYAVMIGTDGAVHGVEIMSCQSGYGAVRSPLWLHQFSGARRGQYDRAAIKTIAGTSLSSIHLAEGVGRVLVIHDTLLKQRR